MTAPQSQLDDAKVEAFMEKALSDISGAFAVAMCHLGDRLGLFKLLASEGPGTPRDLAARADLDARYVREWASGLAAAGYLDYDPETGEFGLPREHALALAEEGGPMFLGGFYHETPYLWRELDPVAEAFRDGGGVHPSDYHPELWRAMERFTAVWFENHLLQSWIPAAPRVHEKLRSGARVADVGCGRGRAVIKMAQAFPASEFVGFDVFEPLVAAATEKAREAGVDDRVRFESLDASQGLPGRYDVITSFDVVHDTADPLAILRSVQEALEPDGSYLLLEINCSDRLEENFGPVGTAMYGVSVLFCMTVSLAEDGAGLGTMGLPPSRVQEVAAQAGFGQVRELPVESPFNILYELRP